MIKHIREHNEFAFVIAYWLLGMFYNLIFLIFAFFYLPIFLFKKKFNWSFWMRLGFLPKSKIEKLKGKKVIWIHAVSVGEVKVIEELVSKLRQELPDRKLLISTVTSTGNIIAQSIRRSDEAVILSPLDLSFITEKLVSKLRPHLFIIVETEIWPNLILSLHRRDIPIALINGRVSSRSFAGYRKVKPFLKNLLERINLFCMQTESYADRIIFLGAKREKVFVTGNMKFDIADYADKKIADYADKYKYLLGLKQEEKLLVAGSTHPGEEKVILDVYKFLLRDFKDLRLLIAPRHPERSKEIESLICKFGFKPIGISKLGKKTFKLEKGQTVFILDRIGELLSFYSLATVVFMGGSLAKKGGHNILEPAIFGKPIIFGSYMFNFQDISEQFLNNRAAIMVRNKTQLKEEIKDLLYDPLKRQKLGEKARGLVLQNRGATQRNIDLIKLLLMNSCEF